MAASAAAAGIRSRTQSETRGRDWRVPPADRGYPETEGLASLRCPFDILPSSTPRVPLEYARNVVFLDTGVNDAPWTEYYAIL